MTLRHGARRLGHRRRQHQRRASPTRSSRAAPDKTLDDGADRRSTTRTRTSPASPCRTSRSTVHADVVREKRTGHNVVAYLPATGSADRRRRSRGSRSARTTTISATARAGNSLGEQGRSRHTIHHGADDNASGIGGRARHRRDARRRSRGTATCCWPSGRARSSGCSARAAFAAAAAGAARSDRRLPELRHGRPHAGQQADRAGDRHEPGVGAASSSRPTSPPASICSCRTIPYQPTDVATFNRRRRPVPELLHRHARRLSPADRHGRQDRLRGSRSRRRVRGGDRPAASRTRRSAPQFTKVEQPTQHGGGRAGVRVFTGHDSRLLDRSEGTAAERRRSAAARPNRRACRRATSSSRSPGRRSPTSTTTPTRSTC